MWKIKWAFWLKTDCISKQNNIISYCARVSSTQLQQEMSCLISRVSRLLFKWHGKPLFIHHKLKRRAHGIINLNLHFSSLQLGPFRMISFALRSPKRNAFIKQTRRPCYRLMIASINRAMLDDLAFDCK